MLGEDQAAFGGEGGFGSGGFFASGLAGAFLSRRFWNSATSLGFSIHNHLTNAPQILFRDRYCLVPPTPAGRLKH